MENLVDIYYEKLSDTDKPGNILARFFNAIYERPNSVKDIIMFNKLIKVYGKYIPFFAILDFYAYKESNPENAYGLLSYYCKKRLEEKSGMFVANDAFRSLDSFAKQVADRIEKQKKGDNSG